MKKMICLLGAVLLAVVLLGCSGGKQQRYSETFLDVFDTVTTVVGPASSQKEFDKITRQLYEELLEYHRLFDIYQEYEGITNLKTLNDRAGMGPVQVDERIIALLQSCKEYYLLTGGKVNPAMGSVLSLWHQARTDSLEDPAASYLPEWAALTAAAEHTDMEAVVIDPAAMTVEITDPAVRLDVGAVAKGWAVQRVCGNAPGGFLVSVGGNVCATGPKDAQGTPWIIGIQHPEGSGYLHTVAVTGGSVVTSGDYQRCFSVDGKLYHHIIDPDTLYPSEYWRSVTVVCPDSGLADALSTALFVLPLEEGQQLLSRCGAMAMWMDREGNLHYSPDFEDLIRS